MGREARANDKPTPFAPTPPKPSIPPATAPSTAVGVNGGMLGGMVGGGVVGAVAGVLSGSGSGLSGVLAGVLAGLLAGVMGGLVGGVASGAVSIPQLSLLLRRLDTSRDTTATDEGKQMGEGVVAAPRRGTTAAALSASYGASGVPGRASAAALHLDAALSRSLSLLIHTYGDRLGHFGSNTIGSALPVWRADDPLHAKLEAFLRDAM